MKVKGKKQRTHTSPQTLGGGVSNALVKELAARIEQYGQVVILHLLSSEPRLLQHTEDMECLPFCSTIIGAQVTTVRCLSNLHDTVTSGCTVPTVELAKSHNCKSLPTITALTVCSRCAGSTHTGWLY